MKIFYIRCITSTTVGGEICIFKSLDDAIEYADSLWNNEVCTSVVDDYGEICWKSPNFKSLKPNTL
jgi:hypothetical protein